MESQNNPTEDKMWKKGEGIIVYSDIDNNSIYIVIIN